MPILQLHRPTAVVVALGLCVLAALSGCAASTRGHGQPGGSSQPVSSSAAAPSTSAPNRPGPCGYTPIQSTGDTKDVGLPPDPVPTPTGDRTMTITTNRGVVTIRLAGSLAPCNVQSVAYLVGRHFYDKSSCHRLVTEGIFVLQCGDPSGSGAGGPTYTVKDENLDKVRYSLGAVAMANAGANTNGSQFFILTKDSNDALAKSYSQIGTVTAGMDIIETVAAGGSDGSNGTGDGKPLLALTFTSVTVS